MPNIHVQVPNLNIQMFLNIQSRRKIKIDTFYNLLIGLLDFSTIIVRRIIFVETLYAIVGCCQTL
jgi:hypothetical protein